MLSSSLKQYYTTLMTDTVIFPYRSFSIMCTSKNSSNDCKIALLDGTTAREKGPVWTARRKITVATGWMISLYNYVCCSYCSFWLFETDVPDSSEMTVRWRTDEPRCLRPSSINPSGLIPPTRKLYKHISIGVNAIQTITISTTAERVDPQTYRRPAAIVRFNNCIDCSVTASL